MSPAHFIVPQDGVGPHVTDAEYDENGVDRTLIRRNLALTPSERLRAHDALLADVERFARAGRAARNGRP